MDIEINNVFRKNPNLKGPNSSEYIDKKEYEFRVKELIRCKNDVEYFAENYFTIVTPGVGKHLIKLYPKQKELLATFRDFNRVVTLASRQSGKTTTYSILCLWKAIFTKDYKILIGANKESTSFEIMGRIKLAYEYLPNWLKCGIITWNKSTIEFANDSKITGIPTASDSGRSGSYSMLLLDEFAFVPQNICEEFWNAVYPIISVDPESKIIIVSTPNGIGNMFYDFWSNAQYNVEESNRYKWFPFRIDWWDVPSRDEKWKEKTLADMQYDKIAFGQEYGNEFLSSSYSLIPGDVLQKIITKNQTLTKKPERVNILENNDDRFIINIYKPYEKDHAYVMGADAGDGVGADFSTMGIFDISDTSDIQQVVGYGRNDISPNEFAFILNHTGLLFGGAPLYLESNGIGSAILELLWNIYEYENILDFGSDKSSTPGIFSTNATKVMACYWVNQLLKNPNINITIREHLILTEIPTFIMKKLPNGGVTFKAAPGKLDDFMMMFIWAMFGLHKEVCEYFFNIESYFNTEVSKDIIPHKIIPLNSAYYNSSNNTKSQIEKGIKTFNQMVGLPTPENSDDDGYVLGICNF
jgi:hypothetical protein